MADERRNTVHFVITDIGDAGSEVVFYLRAADGTQTTQSVPKDSQLGEVFMARMRVLEEAERAPVG